MNIEDQKNILNTNLDLGTDNTPIDNLGNTLQYGSIAPESAEIQAPNLRNSRKMIPITELPTELLISIFSYLDYGSLSTIDQVCRKWNRIMNDSQAWKEAFKKRFKSGYHLPSVSRSKSWRKEFASRENIRSIWRSKSSSCTTYRLDNLFITDVIPDFRSGLLITFSILSGNLATSFIKTGKHERHYSVLSPSQTSTYKITSKLIVFGSYDGKIYGKTLITKQLQAPLVSFDKSHDSIVTSVDISSLSSKENFGIVSGGLDGQIFLWDSISLGKILREIHLPNSPIIKIASDFKKKIVCFDSHSKISIIDIRNNYEIKTIDTNLELGIETLTDFESIQDHSFIDIDFGGENIIISHKNDILNISFSEGRFGNISRLTLPDNCSTFSRAMGNNSMKDQDDSIAGSDGLMYANILNNGEIIIWNVRNNYQPKIVPQAKLSLSQSSGIDLSRFTFQINACYLVMVVNSEYVKIFNIFSGSALKKFFIRAPKSLSHNFIARTSVLSLSEDLREPAGVVANHNTVQYFQIAEGKTSKSTKKAIIVANKKKKSKQIHEELQEFEYREHESAKTQKLVDEYNGDLDEETMLALAISDNDNTNKTLAFDQEEEDLRLAIEMSKLI